MRNLLVIIALFVIGCDDLAVEDVVEACTVQCEERGGSACVPDCRDYADAYSDCIPEAYALVACMPGDCGLERAELTACAHKTE